MEIKSCSYEDQIAEWKKTFIDPVIDGLPSTDTFAYKLPTDGESDTDTYIILASNHTIINGKEIGEGEAYNGNGETLLANIAETGRKIKEIVDSHKYSAFRLFEVSGNNCRVRIITE